MTLRRYTTFGTFTVALVVGTAALSASCGPTETTCDDGIGCVGEAGSTSAGKGGVSGATAGGSSSGDAGKSGGGSPMTGGSGATAGDGGSGDIGGSGAGGEGGSASAPCAGACMGNTPICKPATDTCVECLEPTDCTTGDENLCDTTSNTCVECLDATTDCGAAAASRCEAGSCAPCEDNNDCAHIAGKTVCDTEAGECVQCTGVDYASCGMDAGTPLVCDTTARSCTTNKEHSVGPCKPCVSDAHCKLGQLCVQQQYGDSDEDVGYFCFWKQGDTTNGAPASCASNGRPYVSAVANQMSIDGAVSTICGLRVSTCTAVNQFSSQDCATSAAADDSKCGFDAPNDAKCLADGGGFTCTITCASDDDRDCPLGIQCDTNASPPVCQL